MSYIPVEKDKIRKIISLIACTAITLTCLNASAFSTQAASSSEIRSQINELQKERSKIQNEMEELKKQHQENQNEIGALIEKKNECILIQYLVYKSKPLDQQSRGFVLY